MIPWFQIDHIQIGPLTIYVWGLLVFFGFFIGSLIAISEAKRKKINVSYIIDMLILIAAGSIIGSRLFFVFEHINDFASNPIRILNISEGGLSFFGGFLFAVMLSLYLIKKRGLSVSKISDLSAPAIALGYGIGRLGCFVIHDHIGKITTFFLGIKMPDGVVRHEPILYEIIFNGALLFAVLWFLRDKIKLDGLLFIIFMLWFSFVRFFTDFLRSNDLPMSDLRYFNLTFAQYISLILFSIGIILLTKRKKFAII